RCGAQLISGLLFAPPGAMQTRFRIHSTPRLPAPICHPVRSFLPPRFRLRDDSSSLQQLPQDVCSAMVGWCALNQENRAGRVVGSLRLDVLVLGRVVEIHPSRFESLKTDITAKFVLRIIIVYQLVTG